MGNAQHWGLRKTRVLPLEDNVLMDGDSGTGRADAGKITVANVHHDWLKLALAPCNVNLMSACCPAKAESGDQTS